MKYQLRFMALHAVLAGSILAQSNTVAGLDGNLYDVNDPRVWGRQGPAYPNGEIGFSAANYICNSGLVTIPFMAAMNPDHPNFAFMITRLSDDRMVQISDRSFVKHAFGSLNWNVGPCTPCQNPGTYSIMGIGCFDVYGSSTNGNRMYLGPADEIDPWLGTWNPVGSYFDRGDPDVGPPMNMDGVRSLNSTQISAFGVVKNRVTVQEQDILVPGSSLYYMIQLVIEREDVSERGNNLSSRGLSLTWNGSSWNESNTSASTYGSVLNRWPGSTLNLGGNGNDDGRFAVAVKVTGPTDGKWHYEYAVHNIDNNRGAASFRIPVCANASVESLGFRDIDSNTLNEWTATVSPGEIMWGAPSGHALQWNSIFNFWFDCDAAPVSGDATLDQALLGPGALSVDVTTEVPGLLPGFNLGAGCGTPGATLWGNGIPSIPNPTYSMTLETAPSTGAFVFYSFIQSNSVISPGCIQYLDNTTFGSWGFVLTNGAGRANLPLPIPSGAPPMMLYFQAAPLETNGPIFGAFGLSNGLAVRVGQSGCL